MIDEINPVHTFIERLRERLEHDIDYALAEFQHSMKGVIPRTQANLMARYVLRQFYEALDD